MVPGAELAPHVERTTTRTFLRKTSCSGGADAAGGNTSRVRGAGDADGSGSDGGPSSTISSTMIDSERPGPSKPRSTGGSIAPTDALREAAAMAARENIADVYEETRDGIRYCLN